VKDFTLSIQKWARPRP